MNRQISPSDWADAIAQRAASIMEVIHSILNQTPEFGLTRGEELRI